MTGGALGDRPLVDGSDEVAHPEVFRVREDAPVLDVAAVVQDEDPPVLEGREGEAQGGPAEQRPELVLELLEPLGGDDRLLVDQVPLDRGEHLLVRHVRRPHDDEPGELERVREEPLAEELVGGGAPQELRARRLVERAGSGAAPAPRGTACRTGCGNAARARSPGRARRG